MIRIFGSAVVLLVAIVAAALFFPPRDTRSALESGPTAATPGTAGAPNAPSVPREPIAPTAAPGQIALEFDEATVTRMAANGVSGVAFDAGPLGSATVRDLSVQLRSGQIQATGTAQLGPTPLALALGGTIQAANGRPRLALSDARIGGVQMPQSARSAVEQSLQAQVDQLVAGQPVRVSSVTIGAGKLTIIGSRT